MEKAKVYDLPTRLFHWIFAALFIGAFGIAKLVDHESPQFSQHMILGLILFFVTTFRVVWGFVGSKYARFSSFPLSPSLLKAYFKEGLAGRGSRYFGHNPASAWSALIMIVLALGLGVTGYLMTTGNKETFEDIHELLANGFAFVVVAHIAGIVLHTLRHKDPIALSMLSGDKKKVDASAPIVRTHGFVALGLLGLVGLLAFQLYGNFDRAQLSTRLFGVTLQLGENELQEHGDRVNDGHGVIDESEEEEHRGEDND